MSLPRGRGTARSAGDRGTGPAPRRRAHHPVARTRGDQIAILSGVKAGDEVVTSGVFKLRNGGAIQINNAVKPGNNPTPRPENS